MAGYVKARGHRNVVYGFAVIYASHRSGRLVDPACVDELLSVVQYGAFAAAAYFLTYPIPTRFVESRPIPGTLVGVTVAVAVAIAPLRHADSRDLFGTPWA